MLVDLLLLPYDSAHRSWRMGAGPERLVAAGLPDALEQLGHQVAITTIELPADRWRAEIRTAFELAAMVTHCVKESQRRGAFPVLLSGNCIGSLGTITALGEGTGIL